MNASNLTGIWTFLADSTFKAITATLHVYPSNIVSTSLHLQCWTHQITYADSSRPHPFYIPLVIWWFHLNSFFPRTVALFNGLPRGCFPDHWNLKIFMLGVNRYPSYISSLFPSLYTLTTTSFSNPLPWMAFGSCVRLTILNNIVSTAMKNYSVFTIQILFLNCAIYKYWYQRHLMPYVKCWILN